MSSGQDGLFSSKFSDQYMQIATEKQLFFLPTSLYNDRHFVIFNGPVSFGQFTSDVSTTLVGKSITGLEF
jgi:hypothetical protein